MNNAPRKRGRPFRSLAVLVLVAWALYALWTVARVHSTGRELKQSIETSWPAGAPPQPGTREQLLATADELASARAWTIGDALAPVAPPTPDERIAATKFFAQHAELRRRFLAAADAAREQTADGGEVTALRETLARAYEQAVHGDAASVGAKLDLADRMLEIGDSGAATFGRPADETTVAQLVVAIEPAYRLSQDLMTEGGAAAQKVLMLAARNYQEKHYAEAASALRLAGELLGALPSQSAAEAMPDWFTALADRDMPSMDPQQATAAVDLAEAMALSTPPSDTVAALLKRARRELDAGRHEEASWWASVTLNALGMSDSAIAAATKNSEEPSEGEDFE